MPGTTISHNYIGASGLSLSANPTYIAPGISIAPTGSPTDQNISAIYGSDGTFWTVVNAGSVVALGNAQGVVLEGGGNVTNTASGAISGVYAIGFGGGEDTPVAPSTVLNQGAITASSVGVDAYDSLVLTNATTGTIAAYDGVLTGGAFHYGGAGTVTNAGVISGTGNGIYFQNTGTLTNLAGGQITATGSAYSEVGVRAQTAPHTYVPTTIINDGTISATRNVYVNPRYSYHGAYGIQLQEGGGSVTNGVDGLITASTTTPTRTVPPFSARALPRWSMPGRFPPIFPTAAAASRSPAAARSPTFPPALSPMTDSAPTPSQSARLDCPIRWSAPSTISAPSMAEHTPPRSGSTAPAASPTRPAARSSAITASSAISAPPPPAPSPMPG